MSHVLQYCLAIVVMIALGGCGGGQLWKEEVAQPDGKHLIVERWTKLGSVFDREPAPLSVPPPVVGYGVRIPLPGGGYATYEGDRNLIPLLALIQGGTAYLALGPWNCLAYEGAGSPIPPYVFLRYERGSWGRLTVDQFPASAIRSNLLVNTGGPGFRELAEAGWISAGVIVERNRSLDQDLREIRRTPPWDSYLACPPGKGNPNTLYPR
ncbi:MAG: hypothetical protein IT495_20660 [Gammaproteobacteria bacterium]|nr:hypothetical protein [Gammaproteobacteria bacterium]